MHSLLALDVSYSIETAMLSYMFGTLSIVVAVLYLHYEPTYENVYFTLFGIPAMHLYSSKPQYG